MVKSFPVVPPQADKEVYYRADTGQKIKDAGGEKVELFKSDGQKRGMNFRVVEVTKPLRSVSRICSHGNRVISTRTSSTSRVGGGLSWSRGTASMYSR